MSHRGWLVASLCVMATANADTLRATRSQPMLEVSHTVDIKISEGVATYTVRRMFSNPGKVADQVELTVNLPYGAAATGLRIKANDRWYDGVLMEREKAEALYREMTGYGEARPKDPALLSWRTADQLSLQVFPVMPGTVSTVEYTLTAPTRYEGGRYHVSYPRTRAAEDPSELLLATPVVQVQPAWGNARTEVLVDGRRVGRGAPVVLLEPARPGWLDEINAALGASYVGSEIVVPASAQSERTFKTVTLAISLQHTYQSDLELMLVPPEGEPVPVHARTGGSANDLRGSYTVELATETKGTGTWRLIASDHAALDVGTLDAWSLQLGTGATQLRVSAEDTPKFIPDAPESASEAGVATISVGPPAITTMNARLGKAVASAKHAFSRLEIDMAPQLVPAPKRAQLVFVVDTSYSQRAEGVAAQLDVIRAYVAHLPDAEVELVTYRRTAERVFGRFVSVAELGDALAVAKYRGKLALGNGSAIDEGARLAAKALADRKGPRRIVLATDELVRSTLDKATALASLAALAPETVVHVVVPSVDGADDILMTRRDTAELAPLATRHHGIFVELAGLGNSASLKQLMPAVLELVRPTRIEKVAVPGFTLESDLLVEGAGVRLMHDTTKAPDTVRITGMIWSDPFVREVRVSNPFSIQTAAFVFGADEHGELSPEEQMKLAMMGRAVSPVTSYIAAEPGVRPSTIGLDEIFGIGGFGSAGVGAGGGGAYGFAAKPDLASLVDTTACVAQVKPAGPWSVAFEVETTLDEIVDVIPRATSPMARCLVETVWSTRLDDRFNLRQNTFAFTLSGPGT